MAVGLEPVPRPGARQDRVPLRRGAAQCAGVTTAGAVVQAGRARARAVSGRSTISIAPRGSGSRKRARAVSTVREPGPGGEPEPEALVERALRGGQHRRRGARAHRGGEVLGEQTAGQAAATVGRAHADPGDRVRGEQPAGHRQLGVPGAQGRHRRGVGVDVGAAQPHALEPGADAGELLGLQAWARNAASHRARPRDGAGVGGPLGDARRRRADLRGGRDHPRLSPRSRRRRPGSARRAGLAAGLRSAAPARRGRAPLRGAGGELAARGGDLAPPGVADGARHSAVAHAAHELRLHRRRARVPLRARRRVQRDEVDVHEPAQLLSRRSSRAGRRATAGR